jgi:site-specific recombinase XerC
VPTVARGELVDTGALAERAAEIAARQAAPLTRHAYAGVYRAFVHSSGATPASTPSQPETCVPTATARTGRRSPATIAKHLSALRLLATALGVDGVRDVRGAKVARGEPRALATDEYARLLRMSDQRTTAGKRDLALLHLLATACAASGASRCRPAGIRCAS